MFVEWKTCTIPCFRAVDPNDFITKLGLDPQVQQDAQEFSKLFMSLLESNLVRQKTESVKTIVQNQFRGEYAYVTKCLKCKKESLRPSYFYELDLALQVLDHYFGHLSVVYSPLYNFISRATNPSTTVLPITPKRRSSAATISITAKTVPLNRTLRGVSGSSSFLLSSTYSSTDSSLTCKGKLQIILFVQYSSNFVSQGKRVARRN